MLSNKRHEAFAGHVAAGKSPTEAAKLCGYTETRATVTASELMKRPEVATRIDQLSEKVTTIATDKAAIDKARVLTELGRIAFFDVRKLFDEAGNLLPVRELDDETAAALAGIDVTEVAVSEDAPLTYTKKVKPVDKKGALELIMRHLGMFNDKTTVRHEFADLTDQEIEARIAALSRAR